VRVRQGDSKAAFSGLICGHGAKPSPPSFACAGASGAGSKFGIIALPAMPRRSKRFSAPPTEAAPAGQAALAHWASCHLLQGNWQWRIELLRLSQHKLLNRVG